MPQLLKAPNVEVNVGALFSYDFDDGYFQSQSPLDYIQHVFIDSIGLLSLWDKAHQSFEPIFTIAETGFGAGLNFLTIWQRWQHWCEQNPQSTLQLHFVSVENAPLNINVLSQVYQGFAGFASLFQQLLEAWPPAWQGCHSRIFDAGRVHLALLFGDACDMLQSHQFFADVWLLDGFAPDKNPTMWSPALFNCVSQKSKPLVQLATFTSASQVQQRLKDNGFDLVIRPGFSQQKMITAVLSHQRAQSATKNSASYLTPKRIAIIGAGYAGLFLTEALQALGCTIDLYDEARHVMQGASNNKAHLLYIHPRVATNDFNGLFEQAYSFATYFYRRRLGVNHTGVLHLIDGWKNKNEQWHKFWPEHWLRHVDQRQLQELVGIPISGEGLWMPHAKTIQPCLIGDEILKNSVNSPYGFNCYYQHELQSISNQGGQWQLQGQCLGEPFSQQGYDCVILASGAGSMQLLQRLGNKCIGQDLLKPSHWRYPLRPIACQSSVCDFKTACALAPKLEGLKASICGKGYITAPDQGQFCVGSRFYPDQIAGAVKLRDHQLNMHDFQAALGIDDADLTQAVVGGHSGTRMQSTDYLPLIGQIFSELGDGLYLTTGFGAKGSLVTPTAARIIVNALFGGAPVLSQAKLALVDPDRFAKRMGKGYS